MSRCGRGIGRVGGGGWVVWPLSVSAERSFASGKCRIRQVIGVKVHQECVYQTNLTFVVELIHHQSPALSEISAYIAAELPAAELEDMPTHRPVHASHSTGTSPRSDSMSRSPGVESKNYLYIQTPVKNEMSCRHTNSNVKDFAVFTSMLSRYQLARGPTLMMKS
jgi:hypothetical protein